jgi:hypothetical protein
MMDFKTLIDRNFSRKAEIILLTMISLVMLARSLTSEPDPELAKELCPVIRLAMWIVGIVGLAGIAAQAIIDLKWPKHRGLEKLCRQLLSDEATDASNIAEMENSQLNEGSPS